ncbi:MAG: hypothetical protein HY913_11465 [Desulfomonile tiedjei]|nr:hypothetical protein [Desulfomonile tiedjei]
MFLDKLWVRIKGDLLIMKDDLAAGASLREKASILLARLEELVKDKELETREGNQESHSSKGSEERDAASGTSAASEDREHAALKDLRREWEELVKLRDETGEKSKDSGTPPPPNPRKLG